MAPHSSTLAWRIPGMGEPGGLPVYGVTQSWTRLKRLSSSSSSSSRGFPGGSAGKEFAHSVGDLGLIPGLGRSPGEGNGYPLQFSGLENSMDCIVHGVARSYFHFLFFYLCFHAIPWLSRAPHLGCQVGLCQVALWFQIFPSSLHPKKTQLPCDLC